jgi:branched-chain amino acid transport system ATP-binding protein
LGVLVLNVENVTCGYGRRAVLHGVSIEIKADECVCLLGENGTGKSTLLKLVVGLLGAQSGMITFDGKDITSASSSRRIGQGIAYVPQHSVVFPDMTVLENLKLGVAGIARGDRAEALERGFATFPKLKELSHRSAGVLSGGERQMVAIGRALASGPSLLVCDEPSAGLSPLYVRLMYQVLDSVREQGISILLAEQNVSAALTFADRAYVLDRGKVVMEGATSHLREDAEFRRGYVTGQAFADKPVEAAWHD